jgi:trans-2,3-dihydro-3-hydroxyanthranilate isomerase
MLRRQSFFWVPKSLSKDKSQQIAKETFAESTFITHINTETNTAENLPLEHEVPGTSWVLMNKIFNDNPVRITMQAVPETIPVHVKDGLFGFKPQPTFFRRLFKDDFPSFRLLSQDG